MRFTVRYEGTDERFCWPAEMECVVGTDVDVVVTSVEVELDVEVMVSAVVELVVVVGATFNEPTVTADVWDNVDPFPSRPESPPPQHFTDPFTNAAHACFAPNAMSTTPDDNPVTD